MSSIASGGERRGGEGKVSLTRALRRMLGMKGCSTLEKDRALFKAFNYFDKDGDGCVSREEFYEACAKLSPDLDAAEISLLFGELDEDGNGEIDFAEFFRAQVRAYNEDMIEGREVLRRSVMLPRATRPRRRLGESDLY